MKEDGIREAFILMVPLDVLASFERYRYRVASFAYEEHRTSKKVWNLC